MSSRILSNLNTRTNTWSHSTDYLPKRKGGSFGCGVLLVTIIFMVVAVYMLAYAGVLGTEGVSASSNFTSLLCEALVEQGQELPALCEGY